MLHLQTSKNGPFKSTTLSHKFLHSTILPVLLIFQLVYTGAKKLPDINWESRNTMFEKSTTEYVKEVAILDRVTFLCPRPLVVQKASSRLFSSYEYSKLFMVSKEGYEKCELIDEHQLGTCVTPEQRSSISLVFRDFSPLPSALKFQEGKSYYVITTSSGTINGLNNTKGGLCQEKNMKVKFDVVKEQSTKQLPRELYNEIEFTSASPILYVIHSGDQQILDEGKSEMFPSPISGTDKNYSKDGVLVGTDYSTSAANSYENLSNVVIVGHLFVYLIPMIYRAIC